jgi:peroxiredoxin
MKRLLLNNLNKRSFWVALLGLVLLMGSGSIALSRRPTAPGSAAPALEPMPLVGYPAPDFALKSLTGESVRLSDFKGKPVLINFWATWCGPCRAEFPDFQEAATNNPDTLVIIGVNNTISDPPEQVAAFVTEFGVTFPILLDEQGAVMKQYRVLGMPTSIFVGRDGVIQEIMTGPVNKAYIETKLSEL